MLYTLSAIVTITADGYTFVYKLNFLVLTLKWSVTFYHTLTVYTELLGGGVPINMWCKLLNN